MKNSNANGAVGLQTPTEYLEPLYPLIDPHVEMVKAKRARSSPAERKFADTQVQLKTGKDGDPLLAKFKDIFREMGILGVCGIVSWQENYMARRCSSNER